MKLVLLFLSFLPASILAFCLCPSLNPKYRKEVNKQNHVVVIARANRHIKDIAISASSIMEQYDENQHVPSWPLIRRTVDHYHLETMQWSLFVDSDPQNCIAITPVQNSVRVVWDKNVLDYMWIIRPLAQGTAQLKVQYQFKQSNQVEDEQTITVTVTE
jgi:hypothetical protein